MLTDNTTLGEAIKMLDKFGAAQMSVIARDQYDRPLRGVFVVGDPKLAERIEETIDQWNDGD
jgi:hypothetical protein